MERAADILSGTQTFGHCVSCIGAAHIGGTAGKPVKENTSCVILACLRGMETITTGNLCTVELVDPGCFAKV
jgi:hypothetical protein